MCASSCDVQARRLAFVPPGCALICRCADLVPQRAMLVAVAVSGRVHARERICANMARDINVWERYCGLSTYARRERVLGAIRW